MSNHVVALDPGLRAPGIAVFDGAGQLRWATCLDIGGKIRGAAQWSKMYEALRHLPWRVAVNYTMLVEKPQIYEGAPVNTDDLIELSAALGASVAGLYSRLPITKYVTYLPRQWKGQVPKPIHHARIEKRLTTKEYAAMLESTAGVPENLLHNALDAVGLGMYYLKRMK